MPQDNIIGTILGKQKRLLLNRPSDDWILSDTMLGVEVEVEKVHPTLLPNQHDRPAKRSLPADLSLYWNIHKDDSLHNYGAEFSFVTPMFGEDVSQALKLLLEFQRQEGFDASLRTGIHVHMDARDLSRFQLLGLLAYYIVFEPAIYAWVGEDRDCNNFCVPWYRAEGALQQAIQILVAFRDYYHDANKENENALAYCEQFHRYAGLNLQSLFKFGSIEFRQLKTTFNPNIIRLWINVLLSLKKAAQMAPESSMTIISDIKHKGLKQSALEIFGAGFVKTVWSSDPQIEEKIVDLSLCNAVELINQVNYASSSNGEALTWFPDRDAARAGKNPHPWFLKWRKINFPKDLKIPPEEKLEIRKSSKGKYGAWPYISINLYAQQAAQSQEQAFNNQFAQEFGVIAGAPQVVPGGPQVAPNAAHVIDFQPGTTWPITLNHLDHHRRPDFIPTKTVPTHWKNYMASWGYRMELNAGGEYAGFSGYFYRPQVMNDYYLNNPRPPNLAAPAHDFMLGSPEVPVPPAPAAALPPLGEPYDSIIEEFYDIDNGP